MSWNHPDPRRRRGAGLPAPSPPRRPNPVTPELLAAVANCPDRGETLPVSQQPQHCRGCELTRCRAGKGSRPGAVTLAECLDCRRSVTAAG